MKELNLNNRTIQVREIKYVEILDLQNSGISQKEIMKRLLQLSAGLTEEELNNLSMSEGLKIQKAVNEVNGFDDFQDSVKEKNN